MKRTCQSKGGMEHAPGRCLMQGVGEEGGERRDGVLGTLVLAY